MKQCNRKREVQDDLISTRTPPHPPPPGSWKRAAIVLGRESFWWSSFGEQRVAVQFWM